MLAPIASGVANITATEPASSADVASAASRTATLADFAATAAEDGEYIQSLPKVASSLPKQPVFCFHHWKLLFDYHLVHHENILSIDCSSRCTSGPFASVAPSAHSSTDLVCAGEVTAAANNASLAVTAAAEASTAAARSLAAPEVAAQAAGASYTAAVSALAAAIANSAARSEGFAHHGQILQQAASQVRSSFDVGSRQAD